MRVLFFGRLRDLAGAPEAAAPAGVRTLAELRATLGEANPDLAEALNAPGVRVAVDREFRTGDASLAGVQEIAFMSPLSGG